ncbi:1-deoxy-D-xylulose-5-phosphate synthase [Lachnospira multipara]|uniref:1-deoxy-D-xylulose-5-phosphate synthase n=1 Tax=Lachnospira multipara TaxID=28051 RepID=UPI0004875FBE|nr:1-deoxy-D-xylulose-5-phosphate synthase [Lachnospira multipara]
MILEKINKPGDIKKLSPIEYNQLAEEIRAFLINNISKTGGHLASNLGVVELTIALHVALDLPKDKIIWDVGHQSYTHKILTGRKNRFDQLRKFGGMSGFPKRNESDYDAFDTGHSSTSISAGLGYVQARDCQGQSYSVVSVIGDGALTGGMAYEALNNASSLKTNFIICLNDNAMSISKNIGGVSYMLSDIRSSDSYIDFKENLANNLYKIPGGSKMVNALKKTKNNLKQIILPNQLFESMGIAYLGPVNGHDTEKLIKTFKVAKRINGAVIVHVVTQKGRGYKMAERNPSKYHGIAPFDIKTGKVLKTPTNPTYSSLFSEYICSLAKKDNKICAITAAMPDGTGLSKFSKWFPGRFFDVGIAEEHATTFAAGLAAGGMKPVFAVYSSFLQRAYDQVLHDVCIQQLHVVFAIDRAGLVGADGETHQGIFDLSFLSSIPNMVIFAPKNGVELGDALYFALEKHNGPIAIRYPRGEACVDFAEFREPILLGKSEVLYKEKDIAILAVGSMVKIANNVRLRLKNKGYNVTLVNARFVKPIDEKLILELNNDHDLVVTLEENVASGGYGRAVCQMINDTRLDLACLEIALPDDYIEHGSVDILLKEAGMDEDSVEERIESVYKEIKWQKKD